jgi:hypothetical protein
MVLAAFVAAAADPAFAGAQSCVRVVAPLDGGAYVRPSDFAPVPCPADGTPAAPYRYDAARGAVRLAHALASGDVVAAPPALADRAVVPGQELALLVLAGPVRIERHVVALQGARRGSKLFVRDGDGNVLSVRYEPEAR